MSDGFSPQLIYPIDLFIDQALCTTPLFLTERDVQEGARRRCSEKALLIGQCPCTVYDYRAFTASGNLGAQPSSKQELLTKNATLRAVRLVVRARVATRLGRVASLRPGVYVEWKPL